ncbi:V-set domain containing T-cell activation inhibitor 1-like isoform X2 [Micropterus dolomieu]|uniref:V-set domain containing T-cell activation inhibitor 1-like isoform X2 n=1 Tax=Micropterus dolomieu TaxID=147949 RepID=UPI001E8D54C9|nr:V-set domain containing T-cell activation inhibitor 1-like isoform X2 [Micropterus dolomieu]
MLVKLLTGLALCVVLSVQGEPKLMGSDQPVKASVGQDVILQCCLRPPLDARTRTVEWTLNKTLVHVYRNRRDDPNLQHDNFKGRTSLFHNEMRKGNISLQLFSVNKSDAGNYTCFIPKLGSKVNKGYAVLIVASASVPEDKDILKEASSHNVAIGSGVIVGGVVIIFGIIIIVIVRRKKMSKYK